MSFRLFAFLSAAFLFLSCGTPQTMPGPTCDWRSCAGCCDPSNVCQLGTSSATCGARGGACIACAAAQTCNAGACTSGSTGGGSAGTGGGSVGAVGGGSTHSGGGSGTGGGSSGAGGGSPQMLLNNNPSGCTSYGAVFALPEEAGQWHVSRLTPNSYPFTVATVNWTLVAGPACSSTLPHRVMVWQGVGTTPSASPANTQLASVSPMGGAVVGTGVLLDTPITLTGGESLFVAIEMRVSSLPLCLATCRGHAGQADRNWWSQATQAPFSWVTMASFGLTENSDVTAASY